MTQTQIRSAISAEVITEALRQRHATPHDAWCFFSEMRIGCGYGKNSDKRIDGWAIHCYPSERWKRIAYEIKITRSDFLRELKEPTKRRAALLLSNEFYFVAPTGIIKPAELPPEAGLLELTPENQLRLIVPAPWRDVPPPTWNFLAMMARLVMREQEKTAVLQRKLQECRSTQT